MAQTPALICRLLASSVSITHKAGKIIRDIMQNGDLGIIDKVFIFLINWLKHWQYINKIINWHILPISLFLIINYILQKKN